MIAIAHQRVVLPARRLRLGARIRRAISRVVERVSFKELFCAGVALVVVWAVLIVVFL